MSTPEIAPARDTQNATDAPAPLGFMQQYFWGLLQYPDRGPARFNGNLVIEIFGPLDVPRLGEAIACIEQRHEPLRTCIRLVKGHPRQIVAPPSREPWSFQDLSQLAAPAREAALDAAIRDEMERPLDFVQGPVHRARLLRLSHEEHVLLWTTNHINVDFWSYRNFIGELRATYTALLEGRLPSLPPLPIRFIDFVHAQRATLAQDDRRVAFWRTYLDGHACYRPPHEKPRAPRPSPEQTRSIPLDPRLGERLDQLSRRLGCTRFSIMLTALGLMAQQWSGATDIVALVATANRSPETKYAIGSFAEMLPVRISVESPSLPPPRAPTRADVIRATQSSIRRALIHQLPLRRIEEVTGQPFRFTLGITDHVPFSDPETYAAGERSRSDVRTRWPDAAQIAWKWMSESNAGAASGTFLRACVIPMRMYRVDLLFVVERDLLLCTYQPDLFAIDTIDCALGWFREAAEKISSEAL